MLQEILRRRDTNQFHTLFPDEGPHRRELYPKHLEFFAAGAGWPQRCFMAANRIGKTVSGGYEMTCHLTGLYPPWWEGRVMFRQTDCWVAGKTNETTRDIIQHKLLGKVTYRGNRRVLSGTGIIPGDLIGNVKWKQGVPDLVDHIEIKHTNGKWSMLGFKSYQQGRGAFEGTEKDAIWLDEEPAYDIYDECLIRTATVKGLVLLTFTPLEGMSEVALAFMPKEMRPGGGDA